MSDLERHNNILLTFRVVLKIKSIQKIRFGLYLDFKLAGPESRKREHQNKFYTILPKWFRLDKLG